MNEELSIGAVSSRSGLAVSAIRFYEDRGLITSTRNEGGQRRYRREVLRRLALIQAAQQVGLTLTEISEALTELPPDAGPTKADWKRLSRHWQSVIEHKIHILERLRDQLNNCVGCGCLSLKGCRLYNPDDRVAAEGPGPRLLLGED